MQSVTEAINFLLVNDMCLFCKDELFYFNENIIESAVYKGKSLGGVIAFFFLLFNYK